MKNTNYSHTPTIFPFVPVSEEITARQAFLSGLRKRRIVVTRAHGDITEAGSAALLDAACKAAVKNVKTLYSRSDKSESASNFLYDLYCDTCKTAVQVQQNGIDALFSLDCEDGDGKDVISEAYLALLEKAYAGEITDFQSIHSNLWYAYQRMNAYIRATKKSSASTENYTVFEDEDGHEMYLTDKQAQRRLDSIETRQFMLSVLEIVVESFPKQAKKDKIRDILTAIVIDGETMEDTAARIGLTKGRISQIVTLAQQKAANPALFETLHRAIYGEI